MIRMLMRHFEEAHVVLNNLRYLLCYELLGDRRMKKTFENISLQNNNDMYSNLQ